MSEPTPKAPALDQFITDRFGVDRPAMIRDGRCTWCQKIAGRFRDALSRKEYTISGLCQTCQDLTFNAEEEE